MKKKIYHANVYYKWRTVRFVKGVEKASKKWKKDKYNTCVTESEPKELQKSTRFIRGLQIKHKSTADIEIIIEKIEIIDYLCMSHDVY